MSRISKYIMIIFIVLSLVGCSSKTEDNQTSLDKLIEDVNNEHEEKRLLRKEFAETLDSIEYELLEMQTSFQSAGGRVYNSDKYTEFVVRDSKGEIQVLKYNIEFEDMWILNSDKGYNYLNIVELKVGTYYKERYYNPGILSIEVYYK